MRELLPIVALLKVFSHQVNGTLSVRLIVQMFLYVMEIQLNLVVGLVPLVILLVHIMVVLI